TMLTGSTPVHDLVRETIYRRDGDRPLEIPAGAVVVPGARAAPGAAAARWGISLYAPVIVKYQVLLEHGGRVGLRIPVLRAGDREVPGCEDRRGHRARGVPAMKDYL